MTAPSAPELRSEFLLDGDWAFLNHGSFGACPRPVLAAQDAWRTRMERQPVAFLNREVGDLLAAARATLATALGADPAGLAHVPNATTGVNVVAHGIELAPGDEVLACDHEYGACVSAWRAVCARAGARYVEVALPQPLDDPAAVVAAFAERLGPRTRVVYASHLTSPTGVILPVAELVALAHAHGALAVIDGAHAPGQVPLDLEALGADAYAGNCHKWLCAPKGAGFLHVAPALRARLRPLVVSWDFEDEDFGRRHAWLGTSDPSAYLSVDAALAFQRERDWAAVSSRCRALAAAAATALGELFAAEPLVVGDGARWRAQLVAVDTGGADAEALRAHLQAARVEVPVLEWSGRTLLRVSLQGYNDATDLERLVETLRSRPC